MRFSLPILLCVLCVVYVTGKSYIKGKGRLKCIKGSDDCNTADTGLVCMTYCQPGNESSSDSCSSSGSSEKSSKQSKKKENSYCGAPQAHGSFCDNELPQAEACEEGLSCQLNLNDSDGCHICLPEVPMETPCNDTQWRLVYEHDAFGDAVTGQLQDLYNAVQNGAEVKVWSFVPGLINVQKVSFHAENETELEVHGQALFWVFPSDDVPYNYYVVMSTNGNVHLTSFNIGDGNFEWHIQWFVRDIWSVQDNIPQLRSQIENGASVKVMADQAIRHIEQIDIAGDFLQGWSIWEMQDKLHGLEFNNTEQWLHTHWTESGNMDVASWRVNNPTMEYFVSLQNQAIEWLVDTCWSPIYSHGSDGTALSGSKQDLIVAIEEGKRVKVRIGVRYYEANTLKLIDGEIKMQVYDSINDDVTQGEWKWLCVSTTGEVTTYTNPFDTPDVFTSTSNETVTWFVENRNWTLVADLPGLGGFSAHAVDVRYSVTTDIDVTWYQADIVHPTNGAGHDREFVYVANENEYRQRYMHALDSSPLTIDCFERPLGQTRHQACDITFQSLQWYID